MYATASSSLGIISWLDLALSFLNSVSTLTYAHWCRLTTCNEGMQGRRGIQLPELAPLGPSRKGKGIGSTG